jgi:hypothetical protein
VVVAGGDSAVRIGRVLGRRSSVVYAHLIKGGLLGAFEATKESRRSLGGGPEV